MRVSQLHSNQHARYQESAWHFPIPNHQAKQSHESSLSTACFRGFELEWAVEMKLGEMGLANTQLNHIFRTSDCVAKRKAVTTKTLMFVPYRPWQGVFTCMHTLVGEVHHNMVFGPVLLRVPCCSVGSGCFGVGSMASLQNAKETQDMDGR